jgi:hypothetical protein
VPCLFLTHSSDSFKLLYWLVFISIILNERKCIVEATGSTILLINYKQLHAKNRTKTNSSVVGSLVHLMVRTHLNLAHVDIVANLGKEHWQITKWIFWYLKGAKNSCLVYERYVGYVDSDYANDSQSPN